MSDTAFARASSAWVTFRLEILWGVFAAANLFWMWVDPEEATVPFHFIWISLTLLYGIRTWAPGPTLAVLSAVVLSTTIAQLQFEVNLVELTEVPLMASMFLVMVWHARRRQRAVEELQASAERERDFLRDASHTFRTPITVAHGHAELIQASAATPQIAADADVVIQELRNLSKLSDRILMLAAADHDAFMRFEATSASELVTHVAERWRATEDRDWQVEVDEGDSIVEADRDHLEIALDALLENAVKHTIRSDTVRLVATHETGDAIIRVEDTGAGIRAEHLPHIFERFYGAGAGERRGTGLGLAIVRSVVEAHGGTVRIESQVGEGTTVTIRLPSRARAGLAGAAGVIPQD